MEEKLLEICGYTINKESLSLVETVKNSYSDFNGIVTSIENLKHFLDHSDYYLSLQSDRNMLNIRNSLVSEDDFMLNDSEIIVWANTHKIDIEEGENQICILGFHQKD